MGVPYAEVIGDPIAHSKSPLIHTFWLEKLGIGGEYRRTRVTKEQLESYLRSRRGEPEWRGCNVTMPLKTIAATMVDDLEYPSLEAVNCIVKEGDRLIGRNTDAGGLDLAWPTVDTRVPVSIIGAGGAARAAFESLDVLAVYQFNLIARRADQARALLRIHGDQGAWFPFEEAGSGLSGVAGVVNATPLGMAGFPPMPEVVLEGLRGVRRGGFALDMVYNPIRTSFLERAEREGLEVIDGLTVLIGQASFAFYHFFGEAAPRLHDRELRELLER
jgi:shikimate dehydrogenase